MFSQTMHPQGLLLDEPTSSLDPDMKKAIVQAVRSRVMTFVPSCRIS